MYNFNYTYSTRMTLIFDDEYEVQFVGDLDGATSKIEDAFATYDFDHCCVIDSETGEILIEATNH